MTTGNGEQAESAATGLVLGEPIIITDDVKKWFGDFQALKGITTSVKEREVVVIITSTRQVAEIWRRITPPFVLLRPGSLA